MYNDLVSCLDLEEIQYTQYDACFKFLEIGAFNEHIKRESCQPGI